MTSEQIDALWDISDPAQGYDALRAALHDVPDSADEIRTQLCRALGLQRKFDEAWAELAQVSDRPSPIVRTRVALESGRLKNSSGDRAAAKPLFLQALTEAQAGKFDFYGVDAAHMLGIVTEGAESVDWHEKALQMAQGSTDPRARKWQGSLLNNLGWTYHDGGQFPQALAAFEDGLAFQQESGDDVKVRRAQWAVARCLRSLGRYDEALVIQRELLAFPEAGYVSEEMGELLRLTGHAKEAKPHFQRAFALLSQDEWLVAGESQRLARLQRLSE